ncbi:MAG: molybdopterin molybdotransferase MoeA [Methanobacterium sp.]|uniref:molybdopterin molybdotransferase MoeA n=1 Tax=Methanobacterium sp. TaxID=2164 RepID=UPI003D64F09A|nr:molybdopterin molybdotransferase MoeA [Methanobacterium sp.]
MFLSKLIPLKEALDIINGFNVKISVEKISLKDTYNRVLAENIESLLDSPSFDNSAMDGYALKAEDTFGFSQSNPTYLKVVDSIGAGKASKITVKNGEAIKIATGAPIPQGANAVLMEEYTQKKENDLEVSSTVAPGENVSSRAEDFKKGDLLLKSGKKLRPQDVGIIASAGYSEITVFKKPRIGVITTGSELVMPKTPLNEAEVINSNYYTLKALVESTQAIPDITHCVDDANKVKDQIKTFLKSCDAVITTGGTAISKGDVVVDVVSELGDVLIHGVAIKPGKPFGFGMVDQTPIFMLSGYPVASMVQFDVFVRDTLLKMQQIYRKPPIIKKKASRKIASSLGRTEYIRADTDGNSAYPLKIKGSGIIRSMVESNSYIIIEENVEGIEKGEECNVLLYEALNV